MGSCVKKNTGILTLLLLTVALTGASFAADESTETNHNTASVVEKPKSAIIDGYYHAYPPTTPKTSEDEGLVKRGEYLAKMGDCIACHTNNKEGTPAYAGGLPINTPFGTFYSPNITPDKETGIGNWTEADFIRAMKEGRDPQGRNYFPVFPYIYFSKMTDEDARALYAYFMSIPAVNQKNKDLPFPFGVPGARLSLWGWNFLFFFPDDEPIKYDASKSAEWNRGKYIVDSFGHCGMCHTPLNVFGGPKTRYYLTGGFIDGYWAPNITKFGLESASKEEIANVFTHNKLINNTGTVAGPMAEVNYDSLRYLTQEDKLAIATYLKTVDTPDPLGLPPSEAQPSIQRGKQVYFNACIICHQDGKMSAPVIGDSANWYNRLKSSGLTGLYRHTINGFNSMPVKGACVTCSDKDIISAVDYILNESLTRSQWNDLANSGEKKYPANPEQIYQENCSVCHAEGTNGAPQLGNKAQWTPVLENNFDDLITKLLKGQTHQSVCKQCSTAEVIAATKYMIEQSNTGANFKLW